MRAALSGLTTRGRSFLAAGIAAALCGLVLGEADLLRVGVFLCVLPLGAVALVARTRYRLSCGRRLEPHRVPIGEAAQVVLRLENLSRVPTGVLLLEDRLPYSLGGRPRFVVNRVEAGGSREVVYSVRSDLRGRYVIGPLALRFADAFGLVELSRSFASTDALVVTPAVVPLTHGQLGGTWSGGGESRARSVSTMGEDDVTPREYRYGDDLRRVHWRSTARYGELMVRREEQPWQNRGVLLLDARAAAHRGDGPGSSFEWAVSACASVGAHLAHEGFGMRFVSDTGAELAGASSESSTGVAFAGMLLDELAIISRSTARNLSGAVTNIRRGGGEGLVIAVLGDLHDADVDALSRFRHHATTCIALVLDTQRWGSATTPSAARPHADACSMLTAAGWRVLSAAPRSDLRMLWQEAAAGTRSAAHGGHPMTAAAPSGVAIEDRQ